MGTCVYGISRVVGAECLLVLYGACLLLCILGGLLFRANRTRAARTRYVLGLLITAALADIGMFFLIFPGGEYRNYGIGSTFGALLFPALLAAAAAAITAYNSDTE